MSRAKFGRHLGGGVAGASLLRYGLFKRVRASDPANVIDTAARRTRKPKRQVRLRRDPLDE